MEKISGIYCITNNINGKQYVGLSKDCLKRWSDHYSKSYHSTRPDKQRKALYMAMRKYGRENFSFNILERCEENLLKEREIYWIEKLNTYKNGYNETRGGDLPEGHVLSGESHGMHKLTLEEVKQCRIWYSQGKRAKEIYDLYFSQRLKFSGFQRMWHGKTWKDVMPEVFLNNPHPKTKIDLETIHLIKEQQNQGLRQCDIYRKLNGKISQTSLNDILNKRRYADIQ